MLIDLICVRFSYCEMIIARFLIAVVSLSIGLNSNAQKKIEKTETKPTAKQPAKAKTKTKFFGKKEVRFLNTAMPLVGEIRKLGKENIQYDLPNAVVDQNGHALVAHLTWDGKEDRLLLFKETEEGLVELPSLLAKGVLHQPSMAIDGEGTLWVFWGSTQKDTTVDVMTRSWSQTEGLGKSLKIADSKAAEAFVDAGTDSKGRVWATWQSMRAGEADIYARLYDPAKQSWSNEIPVATKKGGDWAPSIAFDKQGLSLIHISEPTRPY